MCIGLCTCCSISLHGVYCVHTYSCAASLCCCTLDLTMNCRLDGQTVTGSQPQAGFRQRAPWLLVAAAGGLVGVAGSAASLHPAYCSVSRRISLRIIANKACDGTPCARPDNGPEHVVQHTPESASIKIRLVRQQPAARSRYNGSTAAACKHNTVLDIDVRLNTRLPWRPRHHERRRRQSQPRPQLRSPRHQLPWRLQAGRWRDVVGDAIEYDGRKRRKWVGA